jgi:hypothetical protein
VCVGACVCVCVWVGVGVWARVCVWVGGCGCDMETSKLGGVSRFWVVATQMSASMTSRVLSEVSVHL